MRLPVCPWGKNAPLCKGRAFNLRWIAGTSAGFTLLEIIGVLVITGFLTAVIGAGVLYYTKNFLMARRASRLQADGHLAMTRMVEEISLATKISHGTTTVLEFNSGHQDTNQKLALWYDETNKIINLSDALPGGAPNWTTPLASGVEAFQLLYYLTPDAPPKANFRATCDPPFSEKITDYKYQFVNGIPYSSTTGAEDKIEIEFYSGWILPVDDYIVRYCDIEFPAKFHSDGYAYPPYGHWEYEANNPPGYCDKAYIYSVSMGAECNMEVNVGYDAGGSPIPSIPASSPPPLPTATMIELSFTLTDTEGARQDFITRIAASSLR